MRRGWSVQENDCGAPWCQEDGSAEETYRCGAPLVLSSHSEINAILNVCYIQKTSR